MQNGSEDRDRSCHFERLRLRPRERCGSCVVLIEGLLVREWFLADGCRQIVGLYVPGDVCGLDDGPDLVALSPVSCVTVSPHWLAFSAQESGDVMQAVWREMSREAKISAAWIANLGQRPAYQRLAYFMCELEARLRASGRDTSAGLVWPGTQADIGAATGLSLVHVNKTLRRLEAEGLLSNGRRLRCHNMGKLRAIADFDPSYLARDDETLGAMLLARFSVVDSARNGKAFGPLSPEKLCNSAARVVPELRC